MSSVSSGPDEGGPLVLHVPPPFSRRNTLVMVADELARVSGGFGARSAALLATTRDVALHHGESVYVDYRSASPREGYSRSELYRDFLAARCGLPRVHVRRVFRAALPRARELHPALVLLYEGYYALPALSQWRAALPESTLLLYVHNGFSRSYSRGELARGLRHADGVALVSSALRDSLIDRLPRPPCRVEVVHNGVDTAIFTPSNATKRDASSPFVVLFAGLVAPHKGPDRLVRAVAQARRLTTRPLHLHVVGSSAYDASDALTPYELSLRASTAELGLDATFSPFVAHDELPAIYQGADLLCVPSINADPYGLVILEAMACGVPVIASGRGGTREAGGEHAIYVDPDDTDAFARAIADLADDPARAAEIGASSREWAESHSWTDTMAQLLAMAR